jgi:hypothetical protein
LAANLTAVGGALFRTVQLIGKDQRQSQNGGSHPWSLEDSATSTLLLFNPTSEKHRVDVRIVANGKLWLHRYQLEASETKAIDIRAVVASGGKGDNGQILPTDATVGEVNWSTEFAGEGFGRVLVSHPAASLARNFSCGTQYQACGAYLDDDFIDLSPTDSGDMGPLEVYYCLGATACTGEDDYSSSESSVWSSNNSGVASVPSGSWSSASISGHSRGTASILAQGNFGGCDEQSSGSAVVQPAYMVVEDEEVETCDGCYTTVARYTTYGVKYSDNTSVGVIPICESPTVSTSTCTPQRGLSYNKCGSDNASTDETGSFTDEWTVGTDSVTPAGCGFNVTDHWQWYQSATQQITFGTLTGFVHTNSIKINGYTVPPQSGGMPTGFKINP